MSQLNQRLLMSGLFVGLLLTAIFFSQEPYFQPFFVLLSAFTINLALWEYYKIGRIKGFEPLTEIGIIGSTLYVVSTQIDSTILPYVVLALILVTSFGSYFIRGTSPYANIAITLFGIIYLTIPLTMMVQINYFFPLDSDQDGRLWLLYLLLVTKLTDTGAYFFGKQFGKHKLTPYISPNKTWEGAIGGMLTGTIISVVYCYIIPDEYILITFARSLWLGFLLSIIAQFGDLAESLLKRDSGIKDSSTIPGLGGVLDIVDSLIFTAPFLYLYLNLQEPFA